MASQPPAPQAAPAAGESVRTKSLIDGVATQVKTLLDAKLGGLSAAVAESKVHSQTVLNEVLEIRKLLTAIQEKLDSASIAVVADKKKSVKNVVRTTGGEEKTAAEVAGGASVGVAAPGAAPKTEMEAALAEARATANVLMFFKRMCQVKDYREKWLQRVPEAKRDACLASVGKAKEESKKMQSVGAAIWKELGDANQELVRAEYKSAAPVVLNKDPEVPVAAAQPAAALE